jgi:hypothetical protein
LSGHFPGKKQRAIFVELLDAVSSGRLIPDDAFPLELHDQIREICLKKNKRDRTQLQSCWEAVQKFHIEDASTQHEFHRHLSLMTDEDGKKFIAWVPVTTEVDDSILYFPGSPYPFIGRRQPDDSFRLIGDAICHGLHEWRVLGMTEKEFSMLPSVLDKERKVPPSLQPWTMSVAEQRVEEFALWAKRLGMIVLQ